MASFFDRFNSKQLTIVIVCITACFLMMGACTMVLGNEDTDTQKEKKLVFDDDDDGSDEGGRKYKFVDKEDREEGVKGDSMVVNKALEGDPYKELDELIGLEAVKGRCAPLPTMSRCRRHVRRKA